MKQFILLFLLVILIISGWFGYKEYRRYSMIHSGREILLVSEKENAFHYYDHSYPGADVDDILRSFKVIAYTEDLSEEELLELTDRLDFLESGSAKPRMQLPVYSVPQPETNLDQVAWTQLLSTVTDQQNTLCASIDAADFIRYCYVNHLIFNAIKNNTDAVLCDTMIEDRYKEQCKDDLATKNLESYTDEDNNLLLDVLELHVEGI